MSRPVANFGGTIRFTPRCYYTPRTEADVLAILDEHAEGTIRVAGSRHSWNAGIVSADAVIDLRYFKQVEITRDADGTTWVTAGAGIRIRELLRTLHARSEFTLPSLGLITAQTIAGAIATATHGSGRHSLSHYVAELRVAAYDPDTGQARIYTWTATDPELRAARCALGCMGVVLAVRFRCIPRYDVAERMVAGRTVEEALGSAREFPLQQFYLLPHRWGYFVQRRVIAPALRPRNWLARLYRVWWFFGIDVGLHMAILLLVRYVRNAAAMRLYFRHVIPNTVLRNVTIVDRGERMLVMAHELFRHVEIELFVPERHVPRAAAFTRAVLESFAGTAAPTGDAADDLDGAGLTSELRKHWGTYTHHYPVTFRRVLPDDALISMTGGAAEPFHAISFISYTPEDRGFYALASVLARGLGRLFHARPHWGKYFPLGPAEVEAAYRDLPEFRAHCRRVDPRGVFRNPFTAHVLFADAARRLPC